MAEGSAPAGASLRYRADPRLYLRLLSHGLGGGTEGPAPGGRNGSRLSRRLYPGYGQRDPDPSRQQKGRVRPHPYCHHRAVLRRGEPAVTKTKEKHAEKAGSHKDVTILLVGTGVLDGPLAQDLICRKQIIIPDRF